MANNKRKKYLVNRPFQFRFVGTLVLMVVIALLIFSVLTTVYYWVKSMAGDNVFKEYITIRKQVTETCQVEKDGEIVEEEYMVSRVFPGIKRWELVIPPILLNNLIIIIIVIVIGIFYSHRIAGPVYRIQNDIERVLEGEKDIRIVLRRKDSPKEIADSINLLIERVRKDYDKVRTCKDDRGIKSRQQSNSLHIQHTPLLAAGLLIL